MLSVSERRNQCWKGLEGLCLNNLFYGASAEKISGHHLSRWMIFKLYYSHRMLVYTVELGLKETRIKETFGYKKRFHSSDFMQVKLSTLIGQLITETMDKRNPFLIAQ